MIKFTVKQLKTALKGRDSVVIRQSEYFSTINAFKRSTDYKIQDTLTIETKLDHDNKQRFDWHCYTEELQGLLHLPANAQVNFHVRNNYTDQTKEAGFNSFQLMARINIYKANSDRMKSCFDLLIDTETSKINSLGSQVGSV